MKPLAPIFRILLICTILLLCLLPACARSDGPGSSGGPPEKSGGESPASKSELYGSWMELSRNGMKIYTFRKDGSLSVYDMEDATSVRSAQSGSYVLSDSRLTLKIDGKSEVHTLLTGSGDALILDGRILTPTDEPEPE